MSAQTSFVFRGRGGRRPGAGRKPAGARARVSHAARPPVSRHTPLHVTLRMAGGLPTLRQQALVGVVRGALRAGKERFGLRVVHYSIQRDHLHLVVEAVDRRALTRGMHGLGVRLARGINRMLDKKGRVLGDRYHARALRTPREVRNVLAYVLLNARRHGRVGPDAWDLASSAIVFDGWRGAAPERDVVPEVLEEIAGTRAPPRVWLLTTGWRRRGLIDPTSTPGPRRPRAGRAVARGRACDDA